MSNYYNNIETAHNVIYLGKKKANTIFLKTLLLGIMGGIFISLGFLGCLIAMSAPAAGVSVGALKVLGAAIFPIGLILVVIIGGDLFTGNVLTGLAFFEKKISLKSMLSNLTAVWIGNFIGAGLTAYLIYLIGTANADISAVILSTTHAKLHYNDLQTILSGFFCNVLVSLAIWGSLASKDLIGKIFAIWFPIFLFIILGFHHCVANMFLFSFGYLLDNTLSISHLLESIIMATIGNYLSGGLIIPLVYKYLYLQQK